MADPWADAPPRAGRREAAALRLLARRAGEPRRARHARRDRRRDRRAPRAWMAALRAHLFSPGLRRRAPSASACASSSRGFAPSKSQRRAARACRGLRRVGGRARRRRRRASPSTRSGTRTARRPAGGSRTRRPASATPSSSRSRTRARAKPRSTTTTPGGRLVGVGLFDATPQRPVGRVLLLRPRLRAPLARDRERPRPHRRRDASGRPHVYLGYRVAGCASLRYKATFRPHEILTSSGLDLTPVAYRETRLGPRER